MTPQLHEFLKTPLHRIPCGDRRCNYDDHYKNTGHLAKNFQTRGAPTFALFEYTGEVRRPKPGEYFLNPDTGEINLNPEGQGYPELIAFMIYRKTRSDQ